MTELMNILFCTFILPSCVYTQQKAFGLATVHPRQPLFVLFVIYSNCAQYKLIVHSNVYKTMMLITLYTIFGVAHGLMEHTIREGFG